MSDAYGINALALLIPILSVTLSLGALIIWILMWHRRRVYELDCRHKERMAAIEKGLELPPESLPQPVQTPRARYLLRGLIWLGVGLALSLAVHNRFESQVAEFGWIAVAVGAAYLIFYFVEGRKPKVSEHETPPSGSAQL